MNAATGYRFAIGSLGPLIVVGIGKALTIVRAIAQPTLVQLLLRVALAVPFWRSGSLKWSGFLQLNDTAILLFSESNTRFLCEVRPESAAAFEALFQDLPCALVGEVVDTGRLEIVGLPQPFADPNDPGTVEMLAPLVVSAELAVLKEAWQAPLRW